MVRRAAHGMRNLYSAFKGEYHETRHMIRVYARLLRHRIRAHRWERPTAEDLTEARAQLRDIPRFLPFLVIIFLPLPGIVELYIVAAIALERLAKGRISLLPSQLRDLFDKAKRELPQETAPDAVSS